MSGQPGPRNSIIYTGGVKRKRQDDNETEETADSKFRKLETDFLDLSIVEDILWRAGVPLQPIPYVDRRDLIESIRGEIKCLVRSRNGRLVITGQGGQGKTVSIAESLRCPEMVKLFPEGRMAWISVHKGAKPLQKCKDIAEFLDCLNPNATSLEQVQRAIRNCPKMSEVLIILDDVWEPSTAAAFDCVSHAVITSRTSEVADHFRGDYKQQIRITKGFSKQESLSVLFGDDVGGWSIEAEKLHDNCRGWPFLIAIIAAHLRDRPKHWEHYSKCVRMGHLSDIDTVTSTTYPYENADEVIAISYNDLEEPLQSLLQYFAIFASDEYISVQTLSVIVVDQDKVKLEKNLDRLIRKSLVIKKILSDGVETFGVHDILHLFLKSHVNREALCGTVVNLLQTKYTDGHSWASFKVQDKVIWWYLTKFMRKGKLKEALQYFLTDLRGLEVAIKYTDLYHILREYEATKKKSNKICSVMDAFYSFVQSNAETIIRIVSEPQSAGNKGEIQKEFKDMIQVAIFFESRNSPVYKAAKRLAGDEGYWITSSPQTRGVASSEIVWQKEGVEAFDLSSDGKMIAVCKRRGDIALLDVSHGQEVLLIKTPETEWNVRFDRRGQRLVSAELVERPITVWTLPQNDVELSKKGVLEILTKHTWQYSLGVFIKAVSFSHDSTEVLVVSSDGDLQRCSLSDKSTEKYPLGHGVQKYSGTAFSHDGTILALMYKDSPLIIYDTVEKKQLSSDPELTDLRRCAFFPSSDEDESRMALCGGNTIRIWDYKKNSNQLKFQLKESVGCVAVSGCKLFLAVATESHKVHLYSLKSSSILHTIRINDMGLFDHMELICCSSKDGHDHKLLTKVDSCLSMLTFQSEDVHEEETQSNFKPQNCWALQNGHSIILDSNIEGQLEVRILYADGHVQKESLPSLSESIDDENSLESVARLAAIRRCSLSREGTRLAVAIKNIVHTFTLHWSDENLTKIEPHYKGEEKDENILLKFINDEGSRLLIIDCKGSIKVQQDYHTSDLSKIGQLETSDLVDVLYLPTRQSLLIHYVYKVCLLPLENTESSFEVVFQTTWKIDSVSVNSGDRYVAIAYGLGCEVLDLNCSTSKDRVSSADAVAFNTMKQNILCTGERENIRFYSIDNEPMEAREIGSIKVPVDDIRSFCWSPNGEYLAVCSYYGIHLLCYKLTMGAEMLWTIRGRFESDTFNFPFSLSDNSMIAVDGDQNVHVVRTLHDESKHLYV